MSIASLQSNIWSNPVATAVSFPAATGASGRSAPTSQPNAPSGQMQGGFGPSGPNPGQAGAGTAAAGSANLFGNLSADIQAMLVQVLGTTGGPATPAGSAVSGTTPAQNLAATRQGFLSTQGTASGTQMANTDPSDSTGQTHSAHHHHRHHHEAGSADSLMALAAPASSASSVPATSTSGSAGSSDQAVSQVFAAHIMQALHSYGASAATSAMPPLMA